MDPAAWLGLLFRYDGLMSVTTCSMCDLAGVTAVLHQPFEALLNRCLS
jgi:hypothetical protein